MTRRSNQDADAQRAQGPCATGAGQDWTIDTAAPEEVPAVVDHLAGAMPVDRREALRDKLQRYVRKPDRTLLVAHQGRLGLGFNCVIERDTVPPGLAPQEVHRLADFACCNGLLVHPDYRRRGIGAALQLEAEHWARQRDRRGIWLITHRRADWYRKHFGYREIGSTFVKGVEKRVLCKEF